MATDMLLLLCDHVDRLQDYHPQMPKKITEVSKLLNNVSKVILTNDVFVPPRVCTLIYVNSIASFLALWHNVDADMDLI